MGPWAKDPDSKDTVDYLLDILCDIPGILEDMKLLQETPGLFDNLPVIWMALGLRITSCLDSLYLWRAKWENDFSNAYYPVGLDALRDFKLVELETYPFSTAIFFTEPGRATELCLYNSMLVILHRACRKVPSSTVSMVKPSIQPFGNHYRGSRPNVLLAPGEGSMKEIVCEICKMVYCQLSDYPGSTGALHLMFPLQVAYRNIDPKSHTAEWLSTVLSHVADVHGFEVVNFARNSTDVNIIV